MLDWETTGWYKYMDTGQQDLVREAEALFRREVEEKKHTFFDYAFIVFPMAKAYEGFIKKYIYDLGIITKNQYVGEHFRIGKSLNPDLPVRYRKKEWVVDKLDKMCGHISEGELKGESLSQVMWQEWRESRNRLFHYFPDRVHFINLKEAERRLKRLAQVMEASINCPAFIRGQGK